MVAYWSLIRIKRLAMSGQPFKKNGAQGLNRTADTVIFSHVLYQLSYLGIKHRL